MKWTLAPSISVRQWSQAFSLASCSRQSYSSRQYSQSSWR